jgi:aspartate/methionine/tyrosine aminotransferase
MSSKEPQGVRYQFAVIREKMRSHPGPVLDFALGRRRQDPPDWLDGFVREHSRLALRRRTDDEFDDLVSAATGILESVYGSRCEQLSILPAPSGRAALSALVATLIEPDDRILVTEPGYPAFARIAAQAHARLTVVSLDPKIGFAPDLDGLATTKHPVGFAALNYPNNPTGSVLSRESFAVLCECLAPGAVIFNDAIYGPLCFDRAPFSLLSGGDTAAPVVEMHSLGKLFALGPVGVAFLVGPEELIAPIGQFSDFVWTQLSSLQAQVAVRCLDDWEYVDAVRDGLRDRLSELRTVVSRLGFDAYPTEAGMYLLCRAPKRVGDRPTPTAVEAAEVLLENHGLALAPWDVGEDSYVRFSAQYRNEDLGALAALGTALRLAP